MSQVIFLKPRGGLGNQLFQVAAAFAFKKQFGGQIFINIMPNKHSLTDYRTLYMNILPINSDMFTETTYAQFDPFESWMPQTFSGYASITLDGCFQYYPAIESVIDDVRGNIVLPFTQMNQYHDYAFLHIRRGDYLQYSYLHHILPASYYQTALAMLNYEKILVISDDIAWCKNQPWLSKYIFIDEPNEVKTLAIMASCKKGAIIANSTFSWWGAILGKSENVYYPSLWFSDKKPKLFPSSWICI
jgi:hypothetical protein